MISDKSSSSTQGEPQNSTIQKNLVLPPELQVKVVEAYLTENYADHRIHSVDELESTISEVMPKTKDFQPWSEEDHKWAVETVIFSSV